MTYSFIRDGQCFSLNLGTNANFDDITPRVVEPDTMILFGSDLIIVLFHEKDILM